MVRSRSDDGLNKLLAINVRQHREAAGLSQDQLAAKCRLHRTYIGAVERGETNVTLRTLVRLARGSDANRSICFKRRELSMGAFEQIEFCVDRVVQSLVDKKVRRELLQFGGKGVPKAKQTIPTDARSGSSRFPVGRVATILGGPAVFSASRPPWSGEGREAENTTFEGVRTVRGDRTCPRRAFLAPGPPLARFRGGPGARNAVTHTKPGRT